MDSILAFIVAMGITMLLIPLLVKVSKRMGIVDVPGGRRSHAIPIPRVGGIAMAAGMALGLLLVGSLEHRWLGLAAGGAILVAFGVWDDRSELGSTTKFFGQLLAALAVMVLGGVKIASLTVLERQLLPDWIAWPLTLVFIVGVTNAVNLSDGLDGLAGGMILLCLCALTVLSWTVGQPFVISAALSVAGAVAGFLRFNTHPARVFMGDAGSQLLGFAVAVLAIVLTQDPQSPLATALPLLLLGMPIIDTAAVMSERLLAGRSPFKADRNHLHHRLLQLGFDHVEAVALIYLAQAAFFFEAWYLRYEPDLQILVWFVAQAAVVILLPRVAARCGWRRRAAPDPQLADARTRDPSAQSPAEHARQVSSLRAALLWLAAPSRLPVWTQWSTAALLGGYALLVAFAGARPGMDVRVLASLVFLALGAALLFKNRAFTPWCAKAALYVTAALLVYLDLPESLAPAWRGVEYVLLGLMVVCVVAWMRLTARRRFELTPMDLLVVIVAVIAPNLPSSAAGVHNWGMAAVKLIALFYAVEALGVGGVMKARWLNSSVLAFTGVLLLRAI